MKAPLRPYWVRHPNQLAVLIRLLAVFLLVATPFIYVYAALKDHWYGFKMTMRLLWNVLIHGEKAA